MLKNPPTKGVIPMKALGLIVEYNPLHNGHIHHIKQSIKKSNPDITIAVMSGHFTQRGEPTLTNKWNRTKMALEQDIDIVIELPYAYSNQSADLFAKGAISILTHLQIDEIIFGSESGNIEELTNLETLTRSPEFQNNIKTHIKSGLSLPKAYAKENAKLDNLPNNTLGIHYIKAIKDLNSTITPQTLTRTNSNYNDPTPNHSQIASATAIRNLLIQNQDITPYTPTSTSQILEQDPYTHIQTWHHHYKTLKQKILTQSPKQLSQIHDITEGLEHRLISCALKNSNFDSFLSGVSTKRYTNTRIMRICANILTNTRKSDITTWNLDQGAPYIRILGLNKSGATYLKKIKKHIQIPIISKFTQNAHPMLKHEIKITAAYANTLPEPHYTNLIKQEYTQIPIQHKTKE